MIKFLVVMIWPAGIVGIGCLAAILARRQPTAYLAAASETARTFRARWLPLLVGPARAAPAAPIVMRLVVMLACGAALIYAILRPLGLFAEHHTASLDRESYNWIGAHQVHPWTSVMHVLTQIGNPWTTWGAAGAAAACLAVSWRRTQWFPPLVVALLIVVDRLLTLALQHTVRRAGPPHAESSTWPSGGVARAIMFYGLIAFFLWRECGGGRRAGIWAAACVAILTFNEAYSRLYLNVHWLSDIPGGLLYGTLVLTLGVVVVVRITGGPVRAETVRRRFTEPDAAREFTASTSPTPRRSAHAQRREPDRTDADIRDPDRLDPAYQEAGGCRSDPQPGIARTENLRHQRGRQSAMDGASGRGGRG